jgi:hypothetical protein
MIIPKDEIAYDDFNVIDLAGNKITGLVNGDFTKALYNPSGNDVSGAITVTVAELGDGRYRVNFTPNADGDWILIIFHSLYFPEGQDANYRCGNTLVGDDSTMLEELWKWQGLDISNPMTVTPTSRESGTVTATISGDAVTRTVVTRT